jgi:hypothetical protein
MAALATAEQPARRPNRLQLQPEHGRYNAFGHRSPRGLVELPTRLSKPSNPAVSEEKPSFAELTSALDSSGVMAARTRGDFAPW